MFRSKRAEAELRAQSAKLLATRLHTHGVGGERTVSNTELPSNKTKRQLRDRLAANDLAQVVLEVPGTCENEVAGRLGTYLGECVNKKVWLLLGD